MFARSAEPDSMQPHSGHRCTAGDVHSRSLRSAARSGPRPPSRVRCGCSPHVHDEARSDGSGLRSNLLLPPYNGTVSDEAPAGNRGGPAAWVLASYPRARKNASGFAACLDCSPPPSLCNRPVSEPSRAGLSASRMPRSDTTRHPPFLLHLRC
jgi:hypothetical protein